MRILYHHRVLARDGMQVHVEEVVGALRRAGHDVRVVGPNRPARDASSALTRRFAGLRSRLPGWLTELLECAYNGIAYKNLRAGARSFQPDVLYERYNLFLLAGLVFRWRRRLPLLLEVNAPLALERRQHDRLRLYRLARALENLTWRQADIVLPVSDELADHVRAAGVPGARIHVIRNAVAARTLVSAEDDAPCCGESASEGTIVFGFVGFMRPWHGLHRVLTVIAERPETALRLRVIGDGPARADLEAQAQALNIADRLSVTGAVPHARIPSYLRAIDVALQPDVTSYASPLKLFEYMAAGCAIIAPDRANIREILVDGRTALLFDPDVPDSFSRAIDRLAGDGALRQRLGRAAAAEIRARNFTWEGNAERIVELASGLLPTPSVEPNAPDDRAAGAREGA